MKNESNEIKLLNYIYQNAKMGVTGIDDLENKVKDDEFKMCIKKQREEYQKICNEAIEIFVKYGKEEQDLGKMAEMSSYLMTQMKTMMDDSTTNLAKMMMEGSNKGIIEITEKLNHYNESDPEIVRLAQKLLKIEQENLEELKKYL